MRYAFFLLWTLYAHASYPVMDDFSKAKHLSETYQLPLVLVFTGSDWSSLSQKILNDVLETRSFSEEIGSQFIFVKLDFPELNRKQVFILDQCQKLKEEFDVRMFPTLVMLNSAGQEVTRLSYNEMSASQYAKHLKDLFIEYCKLERDFEKVDFFCGGSETLEDLYTRASILGCPHYRQKILSKGIELDQGLFFPLEKYSEYVYEGKMNSIEAVSLREKITKRDVGHDKKVRLRLALLDFQGNQDRPEKAQLALNNYIEEFGEEDQDNLKKLQRIIGDYFMRSSSDPLFN